VSVPRVTALRLLQVNPKGDTKVSVGYAAGTGMLGWKLIMDQETYLLGGLFGGLVVSRIPLSLPGAPHSSLFVFSV
jgi:hypothetical protein